MKSFNLDIREPGADEVLCVMPKNNLVVMNQSLQNYFAICCKTFWYYYKGEKDKKIIMGSSLPALFLE